MDQMEATVEKLLHTVVKINRHEISKKLLNKKTVIITKQEHTKDT